MSDEQAFEKWCDLMPSPTWIVPKSAFKAGIVYERKRSEKLEAALKDMKACVEFYASPWEHINHPDGIMVRKAESYDKFEGWHQRAREVLNKHKDVL